MTNRTLLYYSHLETIATRVLAVKCSDLRILKIAISPSYISDIFNIPAKLDLN